MSWHDGIEFELTFWDRFLRTQGDAWPEDYRRRLEPDRPVNPAYVDLFDQIPADPVRVLDVGAGPLTLFGRKHPRKKILLYATDALALEYDLLLSKHGVVPPVRTTYAEAEKLSRHFPENTFDFVHAQNSIDHCYAPCDAISQMLAVAKPGAQVRLNHAENEAENENYTGFHQWNFTVQNGEFLIRGKDQVINVSRRLAAEAEIEARCVDKWVTVNLRKRAGVSS